MASLVLVIVGIFCLLIEGTYTARDGRPKTLQNSYPKFPHYLQCDPKWGADKMGLKTCTAASCPGARIGRDTVCHQGCAMTSISMALNGYGYEVGGKGSDPGALNQWLVTNYGYECAGGDCNNLVLQQVHKLNSTILYKGEPTASTLGLDGALQLMKEGNVLIAHVRNRTHFVLVDGYDDGKKAFSVLDPFYDTSFYNFANINDFIVYEMS